MGTTPSASGTLDASSSAPGPSVRTWHGGVAWASAAWTSWTSTTGMVRTSGTPTFPLSFPGQPQRSQAADSRFRRNSQTHRRSIGRKGILWTTRSRQRYGLQAEHHPLIFQDACIDAFSTESGSAASLTQDRLGPDNIFHPSVDDLTPLRVETLLQLLPPGLGVVAPYNTSRKGEMQVHDIRGGKYTVPNANVTAMDILRLLVEEETRKGATTAAALSAFNKITVRAGESWLAATTRLLQYFRAAKVDADAPYLVEEEYFWRLLSVSDLLVIMEKAVELCFPQRGDQMVYNAHLVSKRETFEPHLQLLPISRHELGSPGMVYRVTKEAFTKFTTAMTRDASKYASTTAETRHSADMHALFSRKIPPNLRMNPYGAFSSPPTTGKSPALGAVEEIDGDGYRQEANEEHLAALSTRSEGATRDNDRSNDQRPLKRSREDRDADAERRPSRLRRSEDDGSHNPSYMKKQATFSPGATNPANPPRRGRRTPS